MVINCCPSFFRSVLILCTFLIGLLHLDQMANGQTAKLTTRLDVQRNVPIGLLKIIGSTSVSHNERKHVMQLKADHTVQ